MTITASLEADLATVPDAVGITPSTVVALSPSDADLYGGGGYGGYAEGYYGYDTLGTDEVRVYVNGALVRRAFDPEMEQP